MKSLFAAVAALAALVASPASAPAHAPDDTARAVGRTVERTVERVLPTPGTGWYLTAVETYRGRGDARRPVRLRLVLVAPGGDRTRVADLPQRGYRLADWSPDGTTALLVADYPKPVAIRVDVATGDTTRLRLPSRVYSAVLAPDGTGVLGMTYERQRTGQSPLLHVGWDGSHRVLNPDVDAQVLPSPDGAGLLTHGTGWNQRVMRVLSASDGSVSKRIRTPRSCLPVRWWDDHRAVVSCVASRGTTTLGLVDVTAATYKPLTRRVRPQAQDLGHLDAWRAGRTLFVQVAGPCGYEYLGRQDRGGRITQVRVPHAVGNVLLVDAHGRKLTLQHAISCDGAAPRSALTRFDPRTGTERRLVVLPRGQAFAAVLRYGERRPAGA